MIALDQSAAPLDIRRFGAVGDGVHDDTAAIQAAIVAGAEGRGVYVPAGAWAVDGPLEIGQFYGLSIVGESRDASQIVQHGGNTPIIAFTADNTHTVTLERLRLSYGAPQTHDDAPRAAAVARVNLDGESSYNGIYHLSFRDLRIDDAVYGFAILREDGDTTSMNPVWGTDWDRVWMVNTVRTAIQWDAKVGCPANTFRNLKIFNFDQSSDGVGPALDLRCSAVMEAVDIEGWLNRAIDVTTAKQVTIRGLHVEHHHVDNNSGGNWLIWAQGTTFAVEGLTVSYDDETTYNRFVARLTSDVFAELRTGTLVSPGGGHVMAVSVPGGTANTAVSMSGLRGWGARVHPWLAGSGTFAYVNAVDGKAPTPLDGD